MTTIVPNMPRHGSLACEIATTVDAVLVNLSAENRGNVYVAQHGFFSMRRCAFSVRVFQTGATGYAGSVVANALLASGHTIAALAPSDTSAERLRVKGITPIMGTLTDAAVIERAVRDADSVIHQAMTNDATAADADQAAVRAMFRGLGSAEKPFVYTSGVWVLGNITDHIADESTPVNPLPIVAFRPAGEHAVLSRPGIRGIVIRPGDIYGRGGGIVALMMKWARRDGVVKYIGTGENHWPMVYVDDLADLYVRAIERAPGGTLLHACSSVGIRVRDIAEAIARTMGMPGKTQSWSLEEARQRLGSLADALALDLRASGSAAERVLGWKPKGPSLLDDIERGSYAHMRAGTAS